MNVALLAQTDSNYKFEPETLNRIKNANANGGSLSGATIINDDICMKKLKGVGLRAKIQYLLVIKGNQLAGALCPLIYDIGTSVATNYNFVSGDFNANGLKGDGSSKYLDTGAANNAVGSAYSHHLSAYQYDNAAGTVATPQMMIGAYTDVGATQRIALAVNSGTPASTLLVLGQSTISNGAGISDAGYYVGSRTANNSQTLDKNGSQMTINTSTSTETLNTVTVKMFARDDGSTIGRYNPLTYSIFTMGYGLTTTDRTNLNTIITARALAP